MLSRVPDIPPTIPPLKIERSERPLWSVMIPVFNCSSYLEECLNSVLNAITETTHFQIEVIDDASTDADIKKIVEEKGKGKIGYFRQHANVGSLRNFETCINRSKGFLIHLLHGDDKVLPDFYKKMDALFNNNPSLGAGFCRYNYITENGKILFSSDVEKNKDGVLENWLQRIAQRQLIQTPSIVVKREVYEKLGSFYAVHYGEDWEMWVRIAANYAFGYCNQILAEYRQHTNSISGNYFLNGQNIRDLKKVMDINYTRLPKDKRDKILAASRKFYAHYAISTARMLWHKHKNKQASKAQIKEAINLHKDFNILKEILKLNIKFALNIR